MKRTFQRGVTAIALATASLAAQAVQAQSTQDDIRDFADSDTPPDVRERIAAEFEPIGARAGSFFFYPLLTAQTLYSDNLLATDANEESEAWLDVVGGVRIVRPGETTRLALLAQAGQTLHFDNSDEDRFRANGRLFYRLGPVDGSHWNLTINGGLRPIDRRDINDVKNARSPIQTHYVNADTSYTWRFNRLALILGGEAARVDYRNGQDRAGVPIDQDYRDYSRFSGKAEARYDVSPELSVIGRGSFARLDYDLDFGDADFDVTSDIDRSSDIWRGEAGLGVRLSERIFGSATVGYSHRSFGAQPNKPRNSGGVSFAADLLWLADEATSIRFSADRSFLESASPIIAGYRTVSVEARIDRAIARATIASLFGQVRRLKPIGPQASRTDYGVNGEISHQFSRRYRLFVGVGYTGRTSDFVADEFDEFRARAGVALTF